MTTLQPLSTQEDYNALLDLVVTTIKLKGQRVLLLNKRFNLPSVNGNKDEYERITNEINQVTLEWDNSCARLAVWLEDHTTAEWYASRFLNTGLTITKELASQRSTNGN